MESKLWWKSKTILSLGLTAVGIFLPRYFPIINQTVSGIMTVGGLLGAFYGRIVATKNLVATAVKAQQTPPQQ